MCNDLHAPRGVEGTLVPCRGVAGPIGSGGPSRIWTWDQWIMRPYIFGMSSWYFASLVPWRSQNWEAGIRSQD